MTVSLQSVSLALRPPLQSPRKSALLAGARTLKGSGAFGLTEHQLMLADLFKSSSPRIPTGEPKNIDVLTQLARPLPRHKVAKFAEEEEKEREAARKAPKAHDLPEPKNLETLIGLARPTPRLAAKKFDDEMAELKAKP